MPHSYVLALSCLKNICVLPYSEAVKNIEKDTWNLGVIIQQQEE